MWTVFEWVPRTLSGFLALVGGPFFVGSVLHISSPLLSGEFATKTLSKNARARAGAREAPPLCTKQRPDHPRM